MIKSLPGNEGGAFDPWVGKILWRRKCQPTPVFLPRKSHRQKSLAGYSTWGSQKSQTQQQLIKQQHEQFHGHKFENLFFWMSSFKLAFPLPSFTVIKGLFSSFSFSAIRMVLSAYLRLLILLIAILIPAWISSSLAFHMMYFHRLDGHEFEQAPRVGDGQGNLACCSPWGHKESDMTEWLNCWHFWIVPKYFTLDSLLTMRATPFLLRDSCPQ